MMRLQNLFILILLMAGSCKKEQPPTVEVPTETPVTPLPAEEFKCGDLPPVPLPFGWRDSTFDVNQNVTGFFGNPLNAGEIIMIVQGDAFGYNKMLNYNMTTKTMKHLANLDQYLPGMNAKGWIVFSTAENNVYKIKTNGDSLTQLSTRFISHDPKWDATGNYIYFLNKAYNNVPAQLVKADARGIINSALPHSEPLTAVFRKSDKIIMQRTRPEAVTLLMRNMSTFEENELLTVNTGSVSGTPYFNHLTLDNNDENIYWSNKAGIFKCNLASLKTELLFKSCENMIYDYPFIAPGKDEMTFSIHTIKKIAPYQLLHEYKTMELNLNTREVREIRLFN